MSKDFPNLLSSEIYNNFISFAKNEGFTQTSLNSLPFAELESIKQKCSHTSDVVFGSKVACSLGCSPFASFSYFFPVDNNIEPNLFGSVYLDSNIFKSMQNANGAHFLQLAFIKNSSDIDTSKLLAKRSLSGLCRGYMAKTRASETSVKLHTDLLNVLFSPLHLSALLTEALKSENLSVDDMFLCIASPTSDFLEKAKTIFSPFIQANEELRKEEQKAKYANCLRENDCTSCDDKIVCDEIRKVL